MKLTHKKNKNWHPGRVGTGIAEEAPLGLQKPKRGPNFQKKKK